MRALVFQLETPLVSPHNRHLRQSPHLLLLFAFPVAKWHLVLSSLANMQPKAHFPVHSERQALRSSYWEKVRCDSAAEQEADCLVVPNRAGEGPRPAAWQSLEAFRLPLRIGLINEKRFSS